MPPIPKTGPATLPLTIRTDAQGGVVEGTLKPGAHVEVINLTTAATQGKKVSDSFTLGTADALGKFSGRLPDVQAGDVLRLRSVDGGGAVGNWLTIRAGGGIPDARNALVAVDNVALKDLGNGTVSISHKDAARPISEPETYVEVRNLRSGENTLIQLDQDGNIPANQVVKGVPSDTFAIFASDGTHNDALTEEAGRITLAGQRPVKDLADPKVHPKYNALDSAGKPVVARFSGPLFKDGASAQDVKQGYLGNCYLCAASAALGAQASQALQKAMKDNGDGTFTVTFKEPSGGGFKDRPITVDGDLYKRSYGEAPIYGTSNAGGSKETMELWFPILEKAFAQWKGGYDVIGSGGQAYEVMSAIVGRPGTNTTFKNNAALAWKLIKTSVDTKSPACAGTFGETEEARYTNTGVHANHAYTVMGYEEKDGVKTVQLRNPWGHGEAGSDGVDDGIFKLPLETFMKLFQNVHTLR